MSLRTWLITSAVGWTWAITLAHGFALPSSNNKKEYIDMSATDIYNSILNDTSTHAPTEVQKKPGETTLWYLISFVLLVTFFLLVSISEFCCKTKRALEPTVEIITEVPHLRAPPPYSLFAPPNYDSIFKSERKPRKYPDLKVPLEMLTAIHTQPSPQPALVFGEVMRRNPMGEDEVVTPPPPP